jgi:hypothetical protein
VPYTFASSEWLSQPATSQALRSKARRGLSQPLGAGSHPMQTVVSITSVLAILGLVVACSGGDEFTSPAPEPPPTSGSGAALPGTGGANAGGAGSSVAGTPVTTGGQSNPETTVSRGTGGEAAPGSSLLLGTGGHTFEATGGRTFEATGGNAPTGGQVGTGGSSAFSCVGCFVLAPSGWDCQPVPAICGAGALYCLKTVCS